MTDPQQILFVGFVLGHGGDALQMLALAAGMRARGTRVHVVVPELAASVDLVQRGALMGVTVERSPWITADAQASRQNLLGLIRLFRSHRAPVLHIHTGDVCLPRLVVLTLDLLRARRVIVTVHSPYDTLEAGGARALFWSAAVRRRIERVVCPSRHGVLTQLRYGAPPDRLITIPNGIDLERFRNGDGSRVRVEPGILSDAPLILFSSRLEPQKRPDHALEAFRRVAAEFPDAHLAFVGSGSLDPALHATAEAAGLSGRVHFMGYRDDVADWLDASTVWLLPTEGENFSLAVLEALAAGCAIVSTRCMGNDEVLMDDKNALLAHVGDVDGIASRLRTLLRDSSLRARLGEQARLDAVPYGVDAMVERYSRCYEMAR